MSSSFKINADQQLDEPPSRDPADTAKPMLGEEFSIHFEGQLTVRCVSQHADGTIEVEVLPGQKRRYGQAGNYRRYRREYPLDFGVWGCGAPKVH